MTTLPSLGTVLRDFFEDYLKLQRGLSLNTVRSYRDSVRLLLLFAARTRGLSVVHLSVSDLTADLVARFLDSLESERGNHVRSRNHRLNALRVLFSFLARRCPECLAEAQRVLAIPMKRTTRPGTSYLERDQVQALLEALPKRGHRALRDRALLLFLYNTGARVSEAAFLKVANLDFEVGPRVRLHGKGDKWRQCPLWLETAKLLKALIVQDGAAGDSSAPVFSHGGEALTRFGIYKVVRRHAAWLEGSARDVPRVTPHVFRHSAATSLLESGAGLNVIRAWLGHASLESTHRYAEVTYRMKAEMVERCAPPEFVPGRPSNYLGWRKSADLLGWLESL